MERFHLLLDVKRSSEFKNGVNVLDSVDAKNEQHAKELFDKRGWGKPGAYIMTDDEAYRDARGIFH